MNLNKQKQGKQAISNESMQFLCAFFPFFGVTFVHDIHKINLDAYFFISNSRVRVECEFESVIIDRESI